MQTLQPCDCCIVLRNGETLTSQYGDTPCSEVSRIILCPLHAAAPAMYEALQMVATTLYDMADSAGDVPEWNESGELYELSRTVRAALAQAERGTI